MYSDDDMLDAYDEESGVYDLSSDSDDDDQHGHSEDESDYGLVEEDMDDSSTHSSQINYIVLTEKDIRMRQENDIKQVSKVLSITNVEASVLLLHYHWNVSKLNDEWFADEDRVRRTVGVFERVSSSHVIVSKKVKCGICFDKFRRIKIVPIVCGHAFCSTCWNGYITTSINDGSGCLMLKCPEPSCHVPIGRDMVEKLVTEESNKDKYDRYFLRSYIEESRKIKWCPAPGCDHAVEFHATGTGINYDVLCLCTHRFCWNCNEDAHSPVDCVTVRQWILKNNAEAENTKWILANSKACPKCKRPIEKNHGCMHMRCTPPCRHEFCWLCLGAWKDHNKYTGGDYSCNKYEKDKRKGVYDEAEKKREMAKRSLERYTHYYERWASNEKSRQKAFGDLEMFLTEKIMKFSEVQCLPETQFKFMTDAWGQIIECRRVLKWTYAYGYYLVESEHEKQCFFEYVQGEAESGLERLHKCVERESEVFLDVGETSGHDFNAFRVKLTTLTSVTKTHFETLVKALENGLSDVKSQASCSKSKVSTKRRR